MQRSQQERRVLRLDLAAHRPGRSVRRTSSSSSNSARAYRWRNCSCGVAAVAEPVEQALVVVASSPCAATTDVAAATSSGSTLPGSAWHSLRTARRPRCVAASSPWMASAATSSPRSLPARSSSPSAGSAEVGDDRRERGRRRRALERRVGVVVEQPAEAAQPEHDRLPHGELALAGEALEERRGTPRRRGGRRRPRSTRRRRGCSARRWPASRAPRR